MRYELLICTRDVLNQTFGKLILIIGKWNIKLPFAELLYKQTDERDQLKIMH